MFFTIKKFLNLEPTSVLMALVLILAGCQSSESSFRGTELNDPVPAKDFTLTDQHGQVFRLSEHRGRVILLFFGYVSCPDVCPLTLSTWKKVQDGLQDKAEQVKFVFVTVDPERDTPENLQRHLSIFSQDFFGLTGTPEKLQTVYKSFGVYREKVSVSTGVTGYLVNHTARIFVIDRKGQWRLSYHFDAPAEDILQDVQLLLEP